MKNQGQLPLGGKKQEPHLGQVGGKADAARRQADKIEELCAEIYRLTGQKVTKDDPILLAALFQSELINKAGENAAALFQDTVAKSVAQLAEAVKEEREQAASLDKSVASAFQQIADGAKKMGEQELAGMQGKFARMASETLDQVRREAAARAPGGLWWKAAVVFLAGSTIGFAGGFMVGKDLAPKLSNDQVRLMHNGMLLDEAWPKLPKSSRELFGVAPKAAGAAAPAAKAGKQ
jgi:hypothetical protein